MCVLSVNDKEINGLSSVIFLRERKHEHDSVGWGILHVLLGLEMGIWGRSCPLA